MKSDLPAIPLDPRGSRTGFDLIRNFPDPRRQISSDSESDQTLDAGSLRLAIIRYIIEYPPELFQHRDTEKIAVLADYLCRFTVPLVPGTVEIVFMVQLGMVCAKALTVVAQHVCAPDILLGFMIRSQER